MSTTSRYIAASPAEIFDVLANGWMYSNWVVGTSHMRAVDSNWPQQGSVLHHAAGIWPLVMRDESVVEEIEPERRLVLTARGRPAGEARIEITLAPENSGTRVTLVETPVSGPAARLHNFGSDALLARRNVEALARLAAIAERRTQPVDD